MRTQRRPMAFASATLLATAVSVGSLMSTPAGAHPRPAASPSAENLEALRWCESENDYGADTGNGYYGAYQFSLETWRGLGYQGYPHQARPQVQDEAAARLQSLYGWGQWPGCAWWLGLS